MTKMYRGRCGGRPNVVFGSLLVAGGALALLNSLGVVELRTVLRTFWPVLMIAWGLTAVYFDYHGRRWMGIFAMALGTVFLGNQLMWWTVRWSMLWPIVLIAAGLRIMLRRPMFDDTGRMLMRRGWHRPRHLPASGGDALPQADTPLNESDEDRTSHRATLREMAVFGGIERRIASQTFRGGEATAVFGGVQLDLRDCRMAGSEAHIDVLAVLGGVSLTIPRDWAVDSRISALLGGVDDRSSPPVDGSTKRLVLTGQTIMGGIEIKN
jgi:predicted membrane protein